MAGTLVVAGLWARPLAESARQAGWEVVALDLFGDADTRRASSTWLRIGDPASLTLDPALLRAALHRAARVPGVLGWVAGSGFEAIPDCLTLQVAGLPLLGMGPAAVRRVRDPASFFAALDRFGLPHPEVALAPPPDPAGWLRKSMRGSGGWHIQPAGAVPASGTDSYWQRVQAGQPMSALFLADGTCARLVALNRLIVQPLGALPYVFAGAVGPVHDPALVRGLQQALARLVPAFGLRGLASLDFLVHAGRPRLLEINPRPSASMVLHPRAWPGGLMRAHVQAVRGELPAGPAFHPPGVRGYRTVFAQRSCRVGTALAAELARAPRCHDVPAPGTWFAAGEPVCSVSTEAVSVAGALTGLAVRVDDVLRRLAAREELAA